MFAWQPSDIPGVPRKVIEHHLAVCPHARPVKQKVRKQALERQEFITEEIRKLEATSLVRGVLHPTWLANPVVVRKANGKWRLCIDYIDIKKACPDAQKVIPDRVKNRGVAKTDTKAFYKKPCQFLECMLILLRPEYAELMLWSSFLKDPEILIFS